MNSSITRFSLDLHSAQSQISIPVLLGDTSRAFHISLSDGGRPYTIEDGCLAKLSIRRPTGTHLEEFCTIENNTTIVYSFDQNENTAAVEGIHDCDITLYGLDGKSIGSPKFSIVVDERVIRRDDINVTDDDKTVIDAMIQAEASRQYAESGRVIAETLRVEAETSRTTAETARALAEADRIAAEKERLNAGKIALESAKSAKLSEENAKASEVASKLSEANAKNSENTARDFADSALQSAGEANESAEISRQIASDMVNIKTRGERNDKRITNLEKGIPSELFETDSSVAHSKVVPTNALPFAEVSKIGGMTYKDGDTLKSTKVTEIESVGANLLVYPYPHTTKTENGVTWTDHGDGSITASGIATDYSSFTIARFSFDRDVTFALNGTNVLQIVAYINIYGKSDELLEQLSVRNTESKTFKKADYPTAVLLLIVLKRDSNSAVSGTFYPMLNYGDTALPFTPYCDAQLPIPTEIQALDGYGEGINETCYNYIDCEEKQFVKRVGKVDMGTLNWVDDSGNNMLRAEVSGLRGSILCTKYETVFSAFDEGIHASIGEVSIFPASVVDVSSLSGEMLYYELSTPEVTDISHLITADNFIEVEGGGTITAVNENSFAVPSEITYMLKEDAV